MKSSIQLKLENLRDRYEEVGHLLSEPDAANDQERFRNLSKEYAELEEVALAYSAYEQAEADLKAEQLAKDSDPDMRAMGEEEVENAKARQTELETQLEILLLPKDPDDSSNVILEVRAGTGGDEAAILQATCSACTAVLPKSKAGSWKCSVAATANTAALRSHQPHFRHRRVFTPEV